MQNSILLISDNEKTAKAVKEKILLLRETDSFQSIGYEYCFERVKQRQPALVFYHYKNENEQELLDFLQKARQTEELRTTAFVLLFEKFDENVLCNAFEKGLTDFILKDATETEFTIRTIWCLQKRENLYENESKKDILAQLKILDKNNEVYTENYTYTVLKEESKSNWGTFAVIAPDINIRSKISLQSLMNIIKKNVRTCDILGYATDFKIYLWFRTTTKENVLKVLEKIKKSLTSDFTICAGYIETKNLEFDTAETLANKALSKALLRGNSFIYAQEPKKKQEINLEENIQNFKAHKENFVKELESILSPLFYQAQKINEEKLFETKITQRVSSEKASFRLENDKGQSTFAVSFPGFTKINIEILHNIKDADLKAEKLSLDSQQLDGKKIEYLLNSFIKEFQDYTKC